MDDPRAEPNDRRRIVVVGPCASGKSTLVDALRRLGYDASVSSQEHSEIPTLWQHTAPDVVIALDIDLATLRQRRGDDWPEAIYRAQHRRLAGAFAAAALVLDASRLNAEAVLAAVIRELHRTREGGDGAAGEHRAR